MKGIRRLAFCTLADYYKSCNILAEKLGKLEPLYPCYDALVAGFVALFANLVHLKGKDN
jgi:hypothetical protein